MHALLWVEEFDLRAPKLVNCLGARCERVLRVQVQAVRGVVSVAIPPRVARCRLVVDVYERLGREDDLEEGGVAASISQPLFCREHELMMASKLVALEHRSAVRSALGLRDVAAHGEDFEGELPRGVLLLEAEQREDEL